MSLPLSSLLFQQRRFHYSKGTATGKHDPKTAQFDLRHIWEAEPQTPDFRQNIYVIIGN